MKKSKPSVLAIILAAVLFLTALLFSAFSGWTLYNCIDLITSTFGEGLTPYKGNEFSIASYIMNSCGIFIAFALTFLTLGVILLKVSRKTTAESPVANIAAKPQVPEAKEDSVFFQPYEVSEASKDELGDLTEEEEKTE